MPSARDEQTDGTSIKGATGAAADWTAKWVECCEDGIPLGEAITPTAVIEVAGSSHRHSPSHSRVLPFSLTLRPVAGDDTSGPLGGCYCTSDIEAGWCCLSSEIATTPSVGKGAGAPSDELLIAVRLEGGLLNPLNTGHWNLRSSVGGGVWRKVGTLPSTEATGGAGSEAAAVAARATAAAAAAHRCLQARTYERLLVNTDRWAM